MHPRKPPISPVFLSTPSARRATEKGVTTYRIRKISIHALREEGDKQRHFLPSLAVEFLSTPSARRATMSRSMVARAVIFLSTPSARRATAVCEGYAEQIVDFYPRPPRGGRRAASSRATSPSNFYPRPPRGGRHDLVTVVHITREFLSTPSARRATSLTSVLWGCSKISIHALREEGDVRRDRHGRHGIVISIHALREEGDSPAAR